VRPHFELVAQSGLQVHPAGADRVFGFSGDDAVSSAGHEWLAHPDHRLSQSRSGFYAALREDLRAYAEKTFRLDAVDKDGVSYRETLQGLVKRSRGARRAKHQAALACPPLPPALKYVWQAFNRLRRRKGSNGFAIDPIGWPDIDAFVRFSRLALTPWEVELIEDLDNLFLANAMAKPEEDETEDE
jgi:hypothetical protein